MNVNVKFEKYILRRWKQGEDWPPERSSGGTYALDYENKQVGAVFGSSINRIFMIQTNPKGKGHGTRFLQMLMEEARRQGRKEFRVDGVTGHTSEDEEVMKYILTKLGFQQIDEDTWIKNL